MKGNRRSGFVFLLFSGCRVLAEDPIPLFPPSSGEIVLTGDSALINVLFPGEAILTDNPTPFHSLFLGEATLAGNPAPTHAQSKYAKKTANVIISTFAAVFFNYYPTEPSIS
ncbi:Hypothetical protein Tpal_1900 [Trichococcus palustris]|uniref:Uncharacterized protein n=1 Tax=Trichococcus palustris TaxID=140314 RepID=A0A143YPV1_9LACT|nr:Hypothetical protein Tpal_1900 [Trichococcus palustris]SFK96751.1 hypothetical protein SAMN04488076_11132 [Trichococcus palustris]